MGLLTVNGIELPIARDSLERGEIEIGGSGRAFSGAAWKSVRARKQTISLTTAPMALADSDAWSALLNGQGVNWSFEADLYSLQGHVATVAGTAARNIATYKFGVASLVIGSAPTSTAAWSVGVGAAWTVACWRRYYTGAAWAWQHRVTTSTGVFYSDGAATTDANPPTVAAGVLTLAGGLNSNSVYYDDLLILPAVVPASWPAAMHAHAAQLPASPSLTVAGDLLGSTLTMQARVAKRKPLETAAGVLWSLGVEMEET